MTTIYLDHNATTPPAPEAVQAVLDCLVHAWGNASSQHTVGQAAKQTMGGARARLAKFLDCKPASIVFTSGATEANHLAVHGALVLRGRARVLVSAVEHAGMHKLVRALPGIEVETLPVRAQGDLDLDAAAVRIDERAAVVSVMAANNETGVLMPIARVAELAHAHGALLHADATQWLGKLPFSFEDCGADLVTVSAHKLHGPKGVGALIVRPGLDLPPLTAGSQERGRRGGTENLPAIAGFAAAADALAQDEGIAARAARMAGLRDRFERGLQERLPGTVIWGRDCERLPNTSYLRFGRLNADLVLDRLERRGVIASTGSACSSGGTEPSHVLAAMGVPRDEALCAIRFSLAHTTTATEIDVALDVVSAELAPLLHATTEGITG